MKQNFSLNINDFWQCIEKKKKKNFNTVACHKIILDLTYCYSLGKNKKYEFTNSVKSMFELKKKMFTTASKHCICTWRTSMLLKVWLSFLHEHCMFNRHLGSEEDWLAS